MDGIVTRIIARLDELGIDQKTFAEEIGVSPTTITDWKTGKSQSYMKKINIISAALASPLQWLVYGEGPSSKLVATRIDEKRKTAAPIGATAVTEDDIKAAFFNGADPTLTQEEMDAMWDDARAYIKFKLQQRRQKQ